MATITRVNALEILDSRGNPTVRVHVALDDGTVAAPRCPRARRQARTKPSSFATATSAYGGKGVLKAVENVVKKIGPAVIGRDPTRQAEIDG